MNNFFKAFLFACIGVTNEVVYTALTEFDYNNHLTWSLTGHTYVCMIVVYALIPFFFDLLKEKIGQRPLLLRLFIYASLIIIVEFIFGFILDQLTGACPWDYTGKSKFEIMGYTRLDYFPLWMGFAFGCEWVLKKLDIDQTKKV